ncbi:hypothetical protein T484DRAFT_1892570, partial [Baffinella frigidus]
MRVGDRAEHDQHIDRGPEVVVSMSRMRVGDGAEDDQLITSSHVAEKPGASANKFRSSTFESTRSATVAPKPSEPVTPKPSGRLQEAANERFDASDASPRESGRTQLKGESGHRQLKRDDGGMSSARSHEKGFGSGGDASPPWRGAEVEDGERSVSPRRGKTKHYSPAGGASDHSDDGGVARRGASAGRRGSSGSDVEASSSDRGAWWGRRRGGSVGGSKVRHMGAFLAANLSFLGPGGSFGVHPPNLEDSSGSSSSSSSGGSSAGSSSSAHKKARRKKRKKKMKEKEKKLHAARAAAGPPQDDSSGSDSGLPPGYNEPLDPSAGVGGIGVGTGPPRDEKNPASGLMGPPRDGG